MVGCCIISLLKKSKKTKYFIRFPYEELSCIIGRKEFYDEGIRISGTGVYAMMRRVLIKLIFAAILGCGESSFVDATQSGSIKLASSFGTESKNITATPNQLQGADIFKMYLQRQKKLENVKILLEAPKGQNNILEKKLALLMKIYRQQYSAFAAKVILRSRGASQTSNNNLPANFAPKISRKYQTIIQEMKELLEEMNQRDAPLVEIYQKVVYCHGLFSHLEALLDEQSRTRTEGQSGVSEEGASGRRQAHEMGGLGSIDHRIHRRDNSVSEEDLRISGPVIVIPISVGKRYGIDRLLDNCDDNR